MAFARTQGGNEEEDLILERRLIWASDRNIRRISSFALVGIAIESDGVPAPVAGAE